jgi:hypothetical protein
VLHHSGIPYTREQGQFRLKRGGVGEREVWEGGDDVKRNAEMKRSREREKEKAGTHQNHPYLPSSIALMKNLHTMSVVALGLPFLETTSRSFSSDQVAMSSMTIKKGESQNGQERLIR